MARSLTRLAATLAVAGVLAAACGGSANQPAAGSAAPSASGAAATNPCAVPVKGKCATEAQSLTASGATFPGPIYTKWVDEYNKLTGVQVNYQAIGSGGGQKGLADKTVDFAGSDVTLTDQQLTDLKVAVLHIPTVMGAVVATYNLPGVTAKLKLSGPTLAGIFSGAVKTWNDPKIAVDNAGVNLPSAPIVPVVRSDGSGTTGVFTDYLSKVDPAFKSAIGSGTAVKWPSGVVGGSGNQGVAGAVAQTPNSIGYVELIYAIQQKLGYAQVKNASGKFMDATLDSTSAAAVGITYPADLRVSITDSPNPDAYPIATFTYFLSYQDIADKAKALAVARFIWWGTHEGQAFAKDLGYAPLPKDAQAKAEAKVMAITGGGAPALPK